eukprot:6051882-Prymnesium_polylepis.1
MCIRDSVTPHVRTDTRSRRARPAQREWAELHARYSPRVLVFEVVLDEHEACGGGGQYSRVGGV